MSNPIRSFQIRPVVLAALGACSSLLVITTTAQAAPTGGAYVADQTQSHVEDATSQGLRLPNTVLCYMNATGANQTEVLNQGNYLALVDEAKCDKGGGGNSDSTSSGAASAPRYIRAVVNSSRTDNNSPLLGKIWFAEDEMRNDSGGSSPGLIYARLSASEAASVNSPYGVFHTDFCGIADGTASCSMYGYAEGNGASVSAFQTGDQNVSMVLTGTTVTGQGRVKVSEPGGAGAVDWTFAYDSSFFRRAGAGGGDQCFDRSFANADKTAWRYGVYSADGARLERSSGFPIKAGSVYGYVGYWGLWLQGGATLNDGDTVTRYAYSNQQAAAGDYTLVKKDGRLKKQTLHGTTLDGIRNVPFFFWVNQDFTDSGGVNRQAGSNLEVKWDGSHFVITGVAQNGPVTPDSNGNTIPDAVLQTSWNINSWSQSLGGPITVITRDGSGAYLAPGAASAVNYRTETVLVPGGSDWPGNLHCVNDCPQGGSTFTTGLDDMGNPAAAFASTTVANWNGGTTTASTRWNWQPVQAGSELHYTANASTGLLTASGGSVAWTSAAPPLNGQYQNGFQSGRLVDDTGLASLQCSANGGSGSGYYCPNRIDSVSTIYVWETGPNSWNKFSGLRSGSSYVQFDAPLSLQYTVPADVSSAYANAQLVLQYNGFGELQGIPGKCVNPGTNAEVPCSNDNSTRWVAAFVIPEGSSISDGSQTYYVKPLEQELRLKKVSAGNCAALTLPVIADSALPGQAGFSDPRVNGALPGVTGAPRVIHGVVQY
jgi:hypothetical protein